jgi:hypothetical protein
MAFGKIGEFKLDRKDKVKKIVSISSSTDDMYLVLTVLLAHPDKNNYSEIKEKDTTINYD